MFVKRIFSYETTYNVVVNNKIIENIWSEIVFNSFPNLPYDKTLYETFGNDPVKSIEVYVVCFILEKNAIIKTLESDFVVIANEMKKT